MNTNNKQFTTDDIAKELGLSRSTVSRALNNNQAVKQSTRDRVMEKARELNFQPNKAARTLVRNKTYTIAVVLFSEPRYFWDNVLQGISKAQQENQCFGIFVEIFRPPIDHPEEQIKILSELKKQKIDALAIAPNRISAIEDYLDYFIHKNIPVLAINIDLPKTKRHLYIGCNYVHAGKVAGELMGKIVRQGKIGVFSFVEETVTTHQRIEGFYSAVRSYEALHLAPTLYFSRTGVDAVPLTRTFLHSNPDIQGIFVSFSILDETAQVLIEEDRTDIVLIGYDLSEETKKHLRSGVIDAVICQEPFNQGYYMIQYASDLLLEKISPKEDIINTKIEVVIKENLCYYSYDSDDKYI